MTLERPTVKRPHRIAFPHAGSHLVGVAAPQRSRLARSHHVRRRPGAFLWQSCEVGRNWLGPFRPQVEISRSLGALPVYAGYSLLRIALAYVLSLIFAITYGYIAAYRPRAERFMIPLLDVLQSIPVLSFLPGVMLAMAALFPGRQLGVELGAVLLIFTGQVWNMAFSFYASLKSIPREMREAATIYRFNWWQRFLQIELPFATIGLVWNSMMSVAGAWFFLMACEQFTDFRLPGLGSYLQTAADNGDTRSILLGIVTMIAVIVLIDQFVWRPVIAWAEKFKMEQVESASTPLPGCSIFSGVRAESRSSASVPFVLSANKWCTTSPAGMRFAHRIGRTRASGVCGSGESLESRLSARSATPWFVSS